MAAANQGQKVLVTGATGFLGSRITQQLLQRTNMSVVGTSSEVEWKGAKLREALLRDETMDEAECIDRLELVNCDML